MMMRRHWSVPIRMQMNSSIGTPCDLRTLLTGTVEIPAKGAPGTAEVPDPPKTGGNFCMNSLKSPFRSVSYNSED